MAPAAGAMNSSVTSLIVAGAAAENLPTRSAVAPATPTPPVAVEPGYLNEYAGSVTLIGLLFELFAGASSAGTVTDATSLPSRVGVKAANVTTTEPPHGAH